MKRRNTTAIGLAAIVAGSSLTQPGCSNPREGMKVAGTVANLLGKVGGSDALEYAGAAMKGTSHFMPDRDASRLKIPPGKFFACTHREDKGLPLIVDGDHEFINKGTRFPAGKGVMIVGSHIIGSKGNYRVDVSDQLEGNVVCQITGKMPLTADMLTLIVPPEYLSPGQSYEARWHMNGKHLGTNSFSIEPKHSNAVVRQKTPRKTKLSLRHASYNPGNDGNKFFAFGKWSDENGDGAVNDLSETQRRRQIFAVGFPLYFAQQLIDTGSGDDISLTVRDSRGEIIAYEKYDVDDSSSLRAFKIENIHEGVYSFVTHVNALQRDKQNIVVLHALNSPEINGPIRAVPLNSHGPVTSQIIAGESDPIYSDQAFAFERWDDSPPIGEVDSRLREFQGRTSSVSYHQSFEYATIVNNISEGVKVEVRFIDQGKIEFSYYYSVGSQGPDITVQSIKPYSLLPGNKNVQVRIGGQKTLETKLVVTE